jgi:pimeloyl-ACP methyl ester carboxylesterase
VTELANSPEWFADAIAAQADDESAVIDGARIAYRVWGRADAAESVVLIHGGAAHARWWDHVAPLLAADRQVIAFDLSGHGDSDHRDRYSLEGWAAEALALARLASSERPVIIGHSLGGVVALQAAMTSGNELGGIVIVDSPLVNFTPEESAAAGRLAFGPPKLYPTRDAVIGRFRPIPNQASLDYVRDHIAAVSVREFPGGWGWKFDSTIFNHAPQLPSLEPLACRSAFFRGENGMVSPAMAETIYEGLGRVTPMIEVPDAGHAIMLDQPVALATGLRTVLAGWDLSAAG